jgi:hypothetical protein
MGKHSLLGYLAIKIISVTEGKYWSTNCEQEVEWLPQPNVYSNVCNIGINDSGFEVVIPKMFSMVDNFTVMVQDGDVHFNVNQFKLLKEKISLQLIYAIMNYSKYDFYEITGYQIRDECLEVRYIIDPFVTPGSCYNDLNLSIKDVFKTYHHRQVGCHNLVNHIDVKPFPGSIPIKGWQV